MTTQTDPTSDAPAEIRIDPETVARFQFHGQDVGWLIDHRAEHRGDHTFLVWEPREGESRSWTYAEFAEETRRVAVEVVRRCPVPLIVDADGLNALAASGDVPGLLRGREAPTVLTPHPGEMARLSGQPVADIQRDRVASARALAEAAAAVVVLKGQGTVVAMPEGHSVVNPTGTPGLATAGTGDVLAGVIGSLLAHRECGQAAIAGVFVHGRAGDLAAGRRGEDALLAGDVADALPEAIESLRGS